MHEMLEDFLVDALERLALLQPQLTRLEIDASDRRLFANIALGLHAICSSAGFFDLSRIEQTARAGETLIEEISACGEATPVDLRRLSSLFAKLDELLAFTARFGHEPPGDQPASPVAAPRGARLHGSSDAVAMLARPPPPPAPERRTLTLRVPATLLDELLGFAADLVHAREALAAQAGSQKETGFDASLRGLAATAEKLRDAALNARTQPFGRSAGRLTRFAERLAREHGKAVFVAVEGAAVAIDNSVAESLQAPLLQLIRGIVMHGIETIDDRKALAKNATGQISLAAHVEGDRLMVTIGHDGRRAPAEPDSCPTEVRAALQALGGDVTFHGDSGIGVWVSLRAAQRLCLAPVLLLRAKDETYAIAQSQAVAIVDLDITEASDIAVQGDCLVCRMHGQTMPAIDLAAALQIAPADGESRQPRMVVKIGAGPAIGLLVDSVETMSEAVIRHLPQLPVTPRCFSGAVAFADGGVALLLDAEGLAAMAGLPIGMHLPPDAVPQPLAPSLFMCRDAAGRLIALPFSSVHRVTPVGSSDVTEAGQQGSIVRMGDRLLPLIGADALPAAGMQAAQGVENILILGGKIAAFGLAVGAILDPACAPPSLGLAAACAGILGCFPHAGETAALLDLGYLVQGAGLSQRHLDTGGPAPPGVLLIDAQPITRDMLVLALHAHGFETLVAADFTSAQQQLAASPDCAALLVDLGQAIDDHDGWLATRKAAGEVGHRAIGLCAAPSSTTLVSARRIGIGRIAGKFDRRSIVAALARAAPHDTESAA